MNAPSLIPVARRALTAFVILGAAGALAQTPQEILAAYQAQAGGKADFSAARGKEFYLAKSANGKACASCHSENPKASGQHERTGRRIDPLAPSANAERLTEMAKVEKWFGRNCRDVLERACTLQEKGDFVAFLIAQ